MEPTPLQLARLTASLASNRRPESSMENTVAVNLSRCELPIIQRGALLLWKACRELFEQTSAQNRRGLRVEDLAMLAATLAYGKPMRDIDRSIVATNAFNLWQSCKQRLIPSSSKESRAALRKDLNESLNLLVSKQPSKFPVTLKKALQLWLPQKRYPDRISLFRHYLRDSFRVSAPSNLEYDSEDASYVPVVRDEKEQIELADKEIVRLRQNGLNADEHIRHMVGFPRWLKGHEAQEQSKKSFKGGKKKAFNKILKRAEAGDANSQNEIGKVYAEGDGVEQDYQKAFKWFTKAAQQGQPHAQRNLGLLYLKGFGVPKNERMANECFSKAQNLLAAQSQKAAAGKKTT